MNHTVKADFALRKAPFYYVKHVENNYRDPDERAVPHKPHKILEALRSDCPRLPQNPE